MAKIRILMLLAALIFSFSVFACVSESGRVSHVPFLGNWQNTKESFFGSGWDQCVFKADFTFDCTNYPKEGDLVLPYEGRWSLVGNELQLHFDVEPLLTFVVLSIDNDALVLQNKAGKTLFYERVKVFK